jgi:hypothetical protein
LEKEITYEEYRKISDKNHIQKIMKMPVRFLLKSGEEFFVKKDGAALALRDGRNCEGAGAGGTNEGCY